MYNAPKIVDYYTFDFGFLEHEDEKKYIEAILKKFEINFEKHNSVYQYWRDKKYTLTTPSMDLILEEVIKVLSEVHLLIRKIDISKISLRDLQRFKKLYIWFYLTKW